MVVFQYADCSSKETFTKKHGPELAGKRCTPQLLTDLTAKANRYILQECSRKSCHSGSGDCAVLLEVVQEGQGTSQLQRYKIHRAGNSICLHGGLESSCRRHFEVWRKGHSAE